MTKEKERIQPRISPADSKRIDRENTPAATEVDENFYPQTASPVRLQRLVSKAGLLEGVVADTPSRHISDSRGYARPQEGIKGLENFAVVTLVAHQLIQKLTMENMGSLASSASFRISSHLDFILSNISYKKTMEAINNPVEKSVSCRTFTHPYVVDGNQMVTTEKVTIYQSKAFATIIENLGAYQEIGAKCSALGMSDPDLAALIENIYVQGELEAFSLDDSKFLLDLSALLYGTEGHRHQSTYIINKMFMDLVKAGIYLFKNMHKILPMAIEGAVNATIMLDKILFIKDLNVTLYYDKSAVLTTPRCKIEEFVTRTNKIVTDWLGHKNCSDYTPQGKYDFIKQHLANWYNVADLGGVRGENFVSFNLDNAQKIKYDQDSADIEPPSKRQIIEGDDRYYTADEEEESEQYYTADEGDEGDDNNAYSDSPPPSAMVLPSVLNFSFGAEQDSGVDDHSPPPSPCLGDITYNA